MVEAPIPHCGATRATAEPGQPRPFSSCRRTCFVSFDLLSGHGSGSAQNLYVIAPEIISRNSGCCFCNGNYFSKKKKTRISIKNRKVTRQIIFVCNIFGSMVTQGWTRTVSFLESNGYLGSSETSACRTKTHVRALCPVSRFKFGPARTGAPRSALLRCCACCCCSSKK